MRDLTEEELELAPDWATHYVVGFFNDVLYQSVNLCWWSGLSSPNQHGGMDSDAVPIPRKTFDITKHKWWCEYSCALVDDLLGIGDSDDKVLLNKKDAIAIAKAFDLTAEDLK